MMLRRLLNHLCLFICSSVHLFILCLNFLFVTVLLSHQNGLFLVPSKMYKFQNEKLPTIPEFFKDKSIFITGGSGFLGKLLIEKLLRSCPEIKNIYFLLRQKRGKSLESRFDKIFNLPLFGPIREQNEDILKKVIPINGDVCKLGLGISEEDRKLLKKEVNIIYHMAASVRFTDPIKYAIYNNLRSTVEIISLSKELENLVLFVHVSTAYTNTTHRYIEEKVYLNDLNWRDALCLANEMDETTLGIFTQKYIESYVNTYAFTKHLAERAVYDLCKGVLPAIIIRPSIVLPCLTEPLEGWIDNINGPVGMSIASVTGFQNLYYKVGEKSKLDFVYADNVTKASLIAVWEKAILRKDINEIPVYNCCSDDRTCVEKFSVGGHMAEQKYPIARKVWIKSSTSFTTCIHYYHTYVLVLLMRYLLLDGIMHLLKKKPVFLSNFRTLYFNNMSAAFFMGTNFIFETENYQRLQNELVDEDKPEFSYYLPKSQHELYIKFAQIMNKYILHENDVNNEKLLKRDYRWRIVDRILKGIIISLVLYILIWKYDLLTVISRNFYNYIYNIDDRLQLTNFN